MDDSDTESEAEMGTAVSDSDDEGDNEVLFTRILETQQKLEEEMREMKRQTSGPEPVSISSTPALTSEVPEFPGNFE